jgi:hypothetical protein
MVKLAIAVLAAFTLMQSAAGDASTGSPAKPTSFIPHAQSHSHVYGAPIGQAIVGHSKASNRKQTQKRSSSPKRQ